MLNIFNDIQPPLKIDQGIRTEAQLQGQQRCEEHVEKQKCCISNHASSNKFRIFHTSGAIGLVNHWNSGLKPGGFWRNLRNLSELYAANF